MTNAVKSNPRDAVLEKLVAALEKNDGTWQKTWSVIADNRPQNPITGTNYRGVNLLSLAVNATMNNYNDPRWCTFNQAKEAGHPVAAGQKCTAQVLFYKVDTILKSGDKEYTLRGKDLHESAEKLINQIYPNKPCKLNREYSVDKAIGFIENQYPNLSHRTSAVAKLTPVFNFSQMENAPELEVKSTVRTWDNNQDIEQLVQNSGVKVVHDQIDSNFYLPGKNEIHLTPKASFDTPEKYYSTLLHEVSHAKIADGTLEFSTDFSKYHEDKTVRAKEELRAEISSVFLCSELGLNYDVQNHANYLNSWLKNIKEDKQEFWSAVSDSNRIANGVLAYENQIEKDKKLTNQKEGEIEMSANSLNKNDQAKLEDVINNYNSILQSIDKKDLLPHQKPNCIYTNSDREIYYSESSVDLHGSMSIDTEKLTIDGEVAYKYEKYGLSPAQTTFNRELLNEIHAELNIIKNHSLDKDLDLTISKEILAKNTPEIYDSKNASLDSDKYYLTNINGQFVAFNIREELLSAVVEDHKQDYKMDKELSDAYYDGSLDDFAKKLAEHEQLEPIEIEEMDQVREQEYQNERD